MSSSKPALMPGTMYPVDIKRQLVALNTSRIKPQLQHFNIIPQQSLAPPRKISGNQSRYPREKP